MAVDVLPSLHSVITVFALGVYFGKIFLKLCLTTLTSVRDLFLFLRQI